VLAVIEGGVLVAECLDSTMDDVFPEMGQISLVRSKVLDVSAKRAILTMTE
jgi:hypothetical protein